MYPGQSSSPLLSCFLLQVGENISELFQSMHFLVHETLNENIAVGSVLAARNIFENPDLNFASQQPTNNNKLSSMQHKLK